METQLHAKKLEKILDGQGCGNGTHERTSVRTNGRTYESEFIGSFRSLKTSGEPMILHRIGLELAAFHRRSTIFKSKRVSLSVK